MGATPALVVAVIVDFSSEDSLPACVDSLVDNGVSSVVVVDNAAPGTSSAFLAGRPVTLVEPSINLGYGRGANRGAAAAPPSEFLLISNPDVVAHPHTVERLVACANRPDVGIVGPTILTPTGSTYPSVRVFPHVWLAAMHALCAPWWPHNPWTTTYRSPAPDGHVDWVSGACFLIRRDLFEQLGGFDERYFMFAEDMDLCWRVQRAGYTVVACPDATVTHVEGVSRQHNPRGMLVAHHVSAARFEWQTARGVRRVLSPVAALVLGVRLAALLLAGTYQRLKGTSVE